MIHSAGILFYKQGIDGIRVWLVHPSSVVHDNSKAKWSIPKGEADTFERLKTCAVREIKEELGLKIKEKNLHYLGYSVYANNKKCVYGFCHPFIGTKKLNWEVDAFVSYPIEEAKQIIHEAQVVFMDRLQEYLTQRKAITI